MEMERATSLRRSSDFGHNLLKAQDPRMDLTAARSTAGTASFSGSTFNLVNSMIGAGILSLPYALSQAGMALGIVLLVGFAALSTMACVLLHRCMISTTKDSYSDMAGELFGPRLAVLVDVVQAVYSYGACVGYLVIYLGNEMP